jgi:UDP-N-acetylmuramyl pentapeptide phosphotransferase/UDP-N-acetylglucosamine-1-phosphate transferase
MHSAVVSLLLSLVATVLLLQCGGRLIKAAVPAPTPFPSRLPSPLPIGGLAIMVGLCGGVLAIVSKLSAYTPFWWLGLSALLPIFIAGGLDDFWLRPSLLRRAAVTACVTAVVCFQFQLSPVWLALAVVFVTAGTHSITAVDSRNGAAAMCSLLIHGALAYVAHSVGDTQIMLAALIVIGALLGVSFFSFQTDLARLGCSGCALAGFSTAALSLCLTARHAEVSLLFSLVLCSHSLIEAACAWKRGGLGGLDSVDNRVPSLLYHRLVRWATGNPPDRRRPERDTSVMPHLWMLSVASIAPALLWWNQTVALAAALAFRILLQWAVGRLLDVPGQAPESTAPDRPGPFKSPAPVTEMTVDPAFFPSSAKHSSSAESSPP